MVAHRSACHNQGVAVEMTDIDLGPCRARKYETGAARWAVILPGAMYLPDAPLLWFSREAVLAAGCNVLAVWDTFDHRGDRQQWVDERLQAALEHVPATTPLLVTKSLTSLAARAAAERALPAVWLTPLISDVHPDAPAVVAGLRASRAATLLVGGTADVSWDGATARAAVPHATVLEIADADHVLQVPGDLERSLAALATVARAVGDFAARMGQA